MHRRLGLLFALGFDTATEISLFGVAAAAGAEGLSFWAIMSFPLLFTAGMALADTADGVCDTDCSLREAIAAAALSPGPDNISFDAGLAGATLSVGEDPNLPGTAFFVTSEIQISGENSPGLVIRPEAGKNIRLFQVAYATPLGLREITLAGGRAIDGPGGAILASIGKVYLDAVTLTDNSSSGSGAGGGAEASCWMLRCCKSRMVTSFGSNSLLSGRQR